MLIYSTKKLLMAFFNAFVEARYCIMCLFRMNAAEGGGGVGGGRTWKLAPKTRISWQGGVSRGILPRKSLKSRGLEMVFSTFSMRYFSKNLNLDKV